MSVTTLFSAGWRSLPLPGYRDSTSSIFSEYLIAVALFRKLLLTDEQEVYLNHYRLLDNQ